MLRYKMAPEDTPIRSWTLRDLDVPWILYFTIVHIGSFYGLQLIYQGNVSWKTIFLSLLLFQIGMIGITAGHHRLWTHRSYKATYPLELFLCLCATVTKILHQLTYSYIARDVDSHFDPPLFC